MRKETAVISLDYEIIVFKEEKMYVAFCPELDLSSCGNSIDQAKDMLKAAVSLFLEEAEKMSTLVDILEESGYKKDENGRWLPPKLVATELVSIS